MPAVVVVSIRVATLMRLVGTKVLNNLSTGDDTAVIGAGVFATGPDGIDVEVIHQFDPAAIAPLGQLGQPLLRQIITQPPA